MTVSNSKSVRHAHCHFIVSSSANTIWLGSHNTPLPATHCGLVVASSDARHVSMRDLSEFMLLYIEWSCAGCFDASRRVLELLNS